MTDLRRAAEMALEALEANLGKWAAKTAAVEALRQALAEEELRQALAEPEPWVKTYCGGKPNYCATQDTTQVTMQVTTQMAKRKSLAELLDSTPECSDHPDAPHGFDRNASHSADRYVCECESWEPVDAVNMCQERVHKTDKLIEEIIQLRDTIVSLKHDTALQNVGTAQQVPTKSDANIAHINRQWVGLTDAEIKEIYKAGWSNNMDFAQAIEAKLKEKNT